VAESIVEHAEDVDGARLAVANAGGLQPEDLRLLALQVRDRLGSGVTVLGSAWEGKAGLVVAVTADLVSRGISAADISGPAASIVGGGGSQDPELSQAGGPQGDRIDDALEEARRIAHRALEG
jgi:alanyl-tRNA synthetase